MDKVKKVILLAIPMSICNFRCHYCYLSQRDERFQGIQPEMKYTPEQVAKALAPERIGGTAYLNFCADGETLLVKNIDLYVKPLLEQGHYVEFVTNLTITSVLDKILLWDADLLKRLEFKCSFHYLELKKKNLLDVFAENVKKIWVAGASANIEITPSDELIPYIDEIKSFSLKNFGALPHFTIARDDRTRGIERLTKLSLKEYNCTWSQFDSSFWEYKTTIFGVKQKRFCYAGDWLLFVNLATGEARQCYKGAYLGNVFADPDKPLPKRPIGKCIQSHCYNGHMLLTLGLIPYATEVGYGDIRNRVCLDGREWLQPELKAFFNSKLVESNEQLSDLQKRKIIIEQRLQRGKDVITYGKDILKSRFKS